MYLSHLDANPKDYAARLELGELLKPIDASSALQQLQEIPASADEYPEAIWHIAHVATAGKRDALAEDALQKLDEVRPNDAGVALSLAELYYRTDRFAESLPWVKRAAHLQSGRAETWLLLAEVLDKLNRSGEMLQPLQEAIKLDPDLYDAHANLCYAFHFSDRLDEAEREAHWCFQRHPDDIAVRRWLAMILRDRGEYDEALEQIRLALTSSPTNVECRIVEADLLLFQRDAEEAYAVLKPLYPTHANRRDFLGSLARAAAMSGRREESRQYLGEIVQLIERETTKE
ncbi:MAG: tetratricopeptide repeat protein [Planctomycetaceae bacterium]|nr:tetratricopeptide repeat protein [Planctomycetaceae bacterium]